MSLKIVTSIILRFISSFTLLVLDTILSPISIILFILLVPVKRANKMYEGMISLRSKPRLYKKRR